jgi:hypothetical protein
MFLIYFSLNVFLKALIDQLIQIRFISGQYYGDEISTTKLWNFSLQIQTGQLKLSNVVPVYRLLFRQQGWCQIHLFTKFESTRNCLREPRNFTIVKWSFCSNYLIGDRGTIRLAQRKWCTGFIVKPVYHEEWNLYPNIVPKQITFSFPKILAIWTWRFLTEVGLIF